MGKTKKLLGRIIDLVCFVIGPCLAVYGIFGYYGGGITRRGGSYPGGWSDDMQAMIVIGVGLICCGLLIKYWTRDRNK